MNFSAKENTTMASQNGADLAKPYYIEAADKMFGEFMEMGHQQAVEAFKYLQRKICEVRFSQNKNMEAELENHAADVKQHAAGTNEIGSAL